METLIQTQNDVIQAVLEIEAEYKRVHGLILTEFDVQCLGTTD
jgi:hypothetical protein